MIRSIVIVIFLVTYNLIVFAQPAERQMSRLEYIERYHDEAIQEMLLSGVPASITLAQGMLESANGNSPLARYANNHFGIKCHAGWDGPTFYQDDDAKDECFRKYYSVYNSFKDHSNFLSTRSRYASLFELKETDYKGWAKGLKKAGYATNPKYADLLIKLIEDNNLMAYDKPKNTKVLAYKAQDRDREDNTISSDERKLDIKVHSNHIKYVIAEASDSYETIAMAYETPVWMINKYNDVKAGSQAKLSEGEVVFLQPKRNKGKASYHTVKKGESMRGISQAYGIKLKKLYSKNNISVGSTPEVGKRLSLIKKST